LNLGGARLAGFVLGARVPTILPAGTEDRAPIFLRAPHNANRL
jgi:hypothetical protein